MGHLRHRWWELKLVQYQRWQAAFTLNISNILILQPNYSSCTYGPVRHSWDGHRDTHTGIIFPALLVKANEQKQRKRGLVEWHTYKKAVRTRDIYVSLLGKISKKDLSEVSRHRWLISQMKGLPWWSSGEECAFQGRGHKFGPWLGN